MFHQEEALCLADLLAKKAVTPEEEKNAWLGWIEAYILHRLDALDDSEKQFVESKLDLDRFFRSQSEEVRYAVNVCIASEGEGLDDLLQHFAATELA